MAPDDPPTTSTDPEPGPAPTPHPPEGSSPSATRRFVWILAAIVVLGLAWRVGLVVATADDTSLCGDRLCGDAVFYSGQARINALGDWFRFEGMEAADHPPLTSVVLTPVSWVFTDSVTAHRLAMALVGAAVIAGVGVLARRVGGDRAGLVAAGLAAVDPNLWMNDVLVMSESLATLGIVAVLWACYRFRDRPTWAAAALVGALVGVAMLARAELALFLPVTLLPLALGRDALGIWARLGRVAVAGAVALAVLAPWAAYNATRFEEPVLLSTNDGLTLLGANCERVYGEADPGGIGFWNLQCAFDAEVSDPPAGPEDDSQTSARYRRVALRYARDHVDRLPAVVSVRVLRGWGFWAPDQMVWLNQGEGRYAWQSWSGYVFWWLSLPAAAYGWWVLRRRGVATWPLVSTAVIVTITMAVFYGIVRFRLPADVAAVVLAAVAVDEVVRRLRREPHAPDDTSDAGPAGEASPSEPAPQH